MYPKSAAINTDAIKRERVLHIKYRYSNVDQEESEQVIDLAKQVDTRLWIGTFFLSIEFEE